MLREEDVGMRQEITQAERNSILFYTGANDKICLNSQMTEEKAFYGISNAYEGINTLLFPGISNEMARIREGRILNPDILDHIQLLMEMYCNIYSSMCKYAAASEAGAVIHTYRVDRMNSLDFLSGGKTCSMLSTSKKRSGTSAFTNKLGLLLLEFNIPGGTPYLDINSVLGGDSKYPDEEEILLPPFLDIELKTAELTEDEKQYRDQNQQPPEAKYLVSVKGPEEERDGGEKAGMGSVMSLFMQISKADETENAKYVWNTLQNNGTLDAEKSQQYQVWKQKLQLCLKMCFAWIRDENYPVDALRKEAEEYMQESYKMRQEYKQYARNNAILLGASLALAVFFNALSFIASIEIFMKILNILMILLASLLIVVEKQCAWNDKYLQRTETFLALDEYLRDMRYELCWDRAKFQEYLVRFKEIVRSDNAMCRDITQKSVEHMESLIECNEKNE